MLQIFTYSTGLAFTGRSAACAPATATRPAAEPRRRLFTIFIVTSKFVVGRVPLAGCLSPWKVPLSSPLNHPVLRLSVPLHRTGRLGDAPLHRVSNLSHGSCTEKKKRNESQAPKRVFRRVLHKWHAAFRSSKPYPAITLNDPEMMFVKLAFSMGC